MTFDEARTPAEKLLDAEILARVKKGVAVLKERYGEDFANHISLEELDLTSATACVLGQLYDEADPSEDEWNKLYSVAHLDPDDDGYTKGLAILDNDVMVVPWEYGFTLPRNESNWTKLQAAWVHELSTLTKS